MSRTTIEHSDGTRTVIRKTWGCGGCGWALLVAFLVFAPAAWVSSGSLPLPVGLLMYAVLAVVLIAGIAQWRAKQYQAPPPPPPPPA